MINENKVKYMTRAALLRQSAGRDTLATERFFAGDYISFQILQNIIVITLGYVLVLAVWVLEKFEELTTMYSVQELILLAKRIGIIYVGVVIIGVFLALAVYLNKFWTARDNHKDYVSALKHIRKLYQREDLNSEDLYGEDFGSKTED